MEKKPTVTTVTVPTAGNKQMTFEEGPAESSGEMAGKALAQQAQAQVNARYIMAMRQPRDLMAVRERVLADCRRPGFAKKAIYHKPIGEGIEGPSIRLAEALARGMTNILTDIAAIFDDEKRRVVRVTATDLESNITYSKDITIPKTIERRAALSGRKVLGQRVNSRGDQVYLLEATDDEILDRENALASKAMRTCLLRLIPGDLMEEAMEQCYRTMADKDAEDPLAMQKEMVDDFGRIRVTVEQLVAFLGHPIEQTAPKEMRLLHGIFTAIEAGETTWAEAMASAGAKDPKEAEKPKDAAPSSLGEVVSKEKEKGKPKEEPKK